MSSMQEMTKLFDAVETVIQKHYNGVTFPKVTNANTAMLDIRIEVHGTSRLAMTSRMCISSAPRLASP